MLKQTLDDVRQEALEPGAVPLQETLIGLDAFVGCPHCGNPVDIRAPVARGCRELAQIVFDRLRDGAPAIELLHPLELVVFDCMKKEREAMVDVLPLRFLLPP